MKYSDKKIVILGAGPSALSLAATLELAKLPYVILEKNDYPGGQLPLIHNEPDDFVVGTYKDGKDIAKKVVEFYDKYSLNIKFNHKIDGVDVLNKKIFFTQNGVKGDMLYDILVLATGSRCKMADKGLVAGFERDIFYRISHVSEVFVNQKVAVIGGGDNATIAALRLADIANEVILIDKNASLNSRPDLISDVVNHPKIKLFNGVMLNRIKGDCCIRSVSCTDEKNGEELKFEIDKIVFKIGYLPNTGIVSGSLQLDEKGYVLVKGKYHTNVKDVFAIGDIVSGAYKRIAIVMGHGTDLGNYFLKEYLIE